MLELPVPFPLFPPLGLLKDHAEAEAPLNREVRQRLEEFPEHLNAMETWRTGILFLMEQTRRPEFQERHYKVLCPIIESMMHWSWLTRDKTLYDWESSDGRAFMHFIMRPPFYWVTSPGCSRYSRKARLNFEDKPLDPDWRPIIRKTLADDDPGLSSKHHRDWFISRGRDYFTFTGAFTSTGSLGISSATAHAFSTQENPFRDISRGDFQARTQTSRAVFTSEQLRELLAIGESLTNYSAKWERVLFVFAAAIHSDIPMRALAATQTIKPVFSYFKAKTTQASASTLTQPTTNFANLYLASQKMLASGPGQFETPLYPGRRCVLATEFQRYFRRYAQYRHLCDPSLNPNSFLIPLGNGADTYGYGSLIEVFNEFTAAILQKLRAKIGWVRMHWIETGKLAPSASLTFLELRHSAKRAGLIPKAIVARDGGSDANTWPDIGVRQSMSTRQWFQSH
ncbi:hypothetical protein [Pseudomonas sp. NA-150]|uniref:hypothetical protein n=1 Tax=Pseudomonas sp. NA-150 TaxID=3367525 RepID=UPI0037C78122